VLLNLINGLDKKRFNSHIFSLKGGILKDKIDKQSCLLTIMRPDSVFDIKIMRRILHVIKQNHVRIVHAHGFDAGYYGAFASMFAKETSCILHYHGRYWKQKLSRRLITQLACFLSQKVVCASQSLKQDMKKVLHLPNPKMMCVYNGIDLGPGQNLSSRRRIREEFNIEEDAVVVGNVANLYPVKGQSFLIEAAKIILGREINAKFLIVGEGPLKSKLKHQANELGIGDKVLVAGQRDDVPDILSAIDIFVLASLSEEISLALLEAMAAGKPVVATAVGGNTEVIENGVNGLFAEPCNSKELAETLLKFIQDKQLSSSIAQQASEKIKKEFNLNQMIADIEQLYQELIDLKRN